MAEGAEDRQSSELLRDGRLQMVAGHRFVIRQRAHRIARCFGDVAQVGVERARCRTIHRRRTVGVRTRRARLGEFRHALDFDAGAGFGLEAAIEPRSDFVDDRLIVLENLCATFGTVGIALRRGLRERRDALGTCAQGIPACASIASISVPTRATSLQTQRMNLLRRHRGRRVALDSVLVVSRAVWQRPRAIVVERFAK